MIWKRKERILGLHVQDNKLRTVELERSGNTFTLLNAAEINTQLSFSEFLRSGKEFTDLAKERFTTECSKFLHQNNFNASKVSIALDSRFVLLHVIPTDPSMTQVEADEHIFWELSNYFGNVSRKDFLTHSYKLKESTSGHGTDVLIVSVQRMLIRFLKQVLVNLQLELSIIDVDQFAAEHALRRNYPNINTKTVLLMGFKDSSLDASILKRGHLTTYRSGKISSEEKLADWIFNKLSKLIDENLTIDELYLHGERVNDQLRNNLHQEILLPVEVLNPFQKFDRANPPKADERAPSQFTACVGVALRTG